MRGGPALVRAGPPRTSAQIKRAWSRPHGSRYTGRAIGHGSNGTLPGVEGESRRTAPRITLTPLARTRRTPLAAIGRHGRHRSPPRLRQRSTLHHHHASTDRAAKRSQPGHHAVAQKPAAEYTPRQAHSKSNPCTRRPAAARGWARQRVRRVRGRAGAVTHPTTGTLRGRDGPWTRPPLRTSLTAGGSVRGRPPVRAAEAHIMRAPTAAQGGARDRSGAANRA